MPGSTHSIAAGIASGAAVSFTPFLGLHFLLGFVLAWIVRGNLLASAFGTAVGNPWTFPLIFALTGEVGALLLGQDVTVNVPALTWDHFWNSPMDYFGSVLPPLLVGSIPVAILVWLLVYLGFRSLISGYRESRDRRKLQRRKNDPISEPISKRRGERRSEHQSERRSGHKDERRSEKDA
jgi:uncharacterized protein